MFKVMSLEQGISSLMMWVFLDQKALVRGKGFEKRDLSDYIELTVCKCTTAEIVGSEVGKPHSLQKNIP